MESMADKTLQKISECEDTAKEAIQNYSESSNLNAYSKFYMEMQKDNFSFYR